MMNTMLARVLVLGLGMTLATSVFFPASTEAETVSFDLGDSSNYSISIEGVTGEFYTGGKTFGKFVDINQDDTKELLVTTIYDNSSTSFIYAIPQAIILSHLSSGTAIDLSDSTQYLVKFRIGNYRSAQNGSIMYDDLDGDGYEDIIVNEWSGDVGDTDTGSVFVIYSDLLTGITGTGNSYNLTASGNYTIRFNGAVAQGRLSTASIPTDLNNNGKKDLVLGAPRANNFRGEIFVIFDDVFADIAKTSTNNHISLADSNNYKVRYHNTIANSGLDIPHYWGAANTFSIAEFDGDEYPELLFAESEPLEDYAGATLIIKGADLNALSGNGHVLDTSVSTSYWIKYIGAGTSSYCDNSYALEFNSYDMTLFISCSYDNPIDYRGSFYMIPASYFNSFVGTGHNIALSNSSSYVLRVAGSADYSDDGSYGLDIHDFGDFDNDGLTDVMVGISYSDTTAPQLLLYGKELEGYEMGGNVIDLRADPFFVPSWLVPYMSYSVNFVDFDDDGTLDLLFSNDTHNANRGQMLIVMNSQSPNVTFDAIPTTISTNQLSISGVVSQSFAFPSFNHPNLHKIYYSLNNGPLELLDCSDGYCNSHNEEFSGALTGLTEGQHSLVVYAQNTFGVLGTTSPQLFTYVVPVTPTPPLSPTPAPTPTPIPVPGAIIPPAFVTLSKIGNLSVINGVYTYYYTTGKNLTFSGTTSPNAQVILTIESDPITCETQADDAGEWTCTFDQEVPNGYHTLTVSAYYPGSSVISTEKYTLGIGVGLADTGDPALIAPLIGLGLLASAGYVLRKRRV